MKIGKTLLFLFAGLQALTSLMLMFTSGPSTFEADTGVAWEELTSVFPTVATQFLGTQQASLIANLGMALLGIAILIFAFEKPQRWAWYSMWVLPASALPGTIQLANTETQWGVAIFAGILILMAVLGLVFSYREIFEKSL